MNWVTALIPALGASVHAGCLAASSTKLALGWNAAAMTGWLCRFVWVACGRRPDDGGAS